MRETYLRGGVGLMVVDVVTGRRPNLHNEWVDLVEAGPRFHLPPEPLYAVAYRPLPEGDGGGSRAMERHPSRSASPYRCCRWRLDKGILAPLDLEAAYQEACERSRLV